MVVMLVQSKLWERDRRTQDKQRLRSLRGKPKVLHLGLASHSDNLDQLLGNSLCRYRETQACRHMEVRREGDVSR